MNQTQIIRVIDSHTAGEPTRVIVDGAPVLQGQTRRTVLPATERAKLYLRSGLSDVLKVTERQPVFVYRQLEKLAVLSK